jgi:hypothetical protein
MDQDIFVTRLRKLAPAFEDFGERNLSDLFKKNFIERYYCPPKPKISQKSYSIDPIISLLQYYDCSKVEIGVVTFLKEIVEEVNYYQIGNIEQDILSVNKTILQIEVLDYLNRDHVIWECASNSGRFLEALLLSAEYFTSRIKSPSLINNHNYTFDRVDMCTEIAGGETYIDFYKMLLGYDN